DQPLRLDRLDVAYGPVKAGLNAPATITRDGGGFTLAGLDAGIGKGRLTGAGRLGARGVDLRLSLADLPLDVVAAFGPETGLTGKASAEVRLAGTMAAPTVHADLRVSDLSIGDTKISEMARATGTVRIDVQNGRAAVAANLGGSPDLSIDGQLTAPLVFRLQPFAADLASDAPISGKAVGKLD